MILPYEDPNLHGRPPEDITLAELQAEFRAGIRTAGGVVCRVTGKVHVRRKRTITDAMALALIALGHADRREPGKWQDLPRLLEKKAHRGGGDEAKLRYWGLIEPQPGVERPDGGPAGMWRITQQGRDFLNGRAVPSHVLVYRDQVEFVRDSYINIDVALGRRFRLDET